MTLTKTATVGLRTAFSVLIAGSLFGNTLVILVVFRNSSMQTPMNILLANLALADLMFAIFIIPLRLLDQEYTHPEGWVGELLCKLITYGNFAWVGSVASVVTLMLIAWERYHAVLNPYAARRRITKERLKQMVIGTWVFSVIFLVPETWSLRFDVIRQSCVYDFPGWMLKLDALLWFLLIGVLPLCWMGICYGRVIQKLWFSQEDTGNISQRAMMQSRKRVTRIVLMVTIVLGCCWLPNLTWYILDSFKVIPAMPLAHAISQVFILNNTAVNPVIYATQDRRFRRLMWRLLTKKCTRDNMVVDLSNPYESATVHGVGLIIHGIVGNKGVISDSLDSSTANHGRMITL